MKTFLLSILLVATGFSFAQTGTIRGTISLEVTNEPAIFAKIILKRNDEIIQRVMSDIDGNFKFSELSPGEYTISAVSIGMDTTMMAGIVVLENKITIVDLSLFENNTRLLICCFCSGEKFYDKNREAGVGIKNE